MFIVSNLLDKFYNLDLVKTISYRKKINTAHKSLEERHISDRSSPIYYIIRYDDGMSCGWTVWERVVLYGCIYALDHNMIPVVDMQTKKNIYLEDSEIGIVNSWDKYYHQPGGVSLGEALHSDNYILADPSQEWFVYLRMRKKKLTNKEYIREQYSKYIRLNQQTIDLCEQNMLAMLPDISNKRLLGLCIRGTDYRVFHHPVQPSTDEVVKKAKHKFEEYNCDYYFIATEDYDIWNQLKSKLPIEKIISYNAGNIKEVNGYIGSQIREIKSANDTAIEYLTVLYILNKCKVLIGGKCGATIVAEYRKNPPYDYIDIIDLNRGY